MAGNNQAHSFTRETTASSEWFQTLVAETSAVDAAGVHAALLSVRIHESVASERTMKQLRTLLGRILSPTDRVEQTANDSMSVLLAPQKDLRQTVTDVREIADALHRAGLRSSTGFAQRRVGESLLDTWARAEAQLDRASYRVETSEGITL